MIEIFDSITHPTINNTWLNPRFSEYSNIKLLLGDMEKFCINRAFAVGLNGVGGYGLQEYIEFLKPYKNLIPIAFCDIDYDYNKLQEIKNMGYKGIKIHPRIAKIEPDDDRIFEIIKNANQLGLIVLYCGFLGVTNKFIENVGDERLIFLHTGGKDLKETFEKLKDKKNVLLDLSYTFNKYDELNDFIVHLFQNYSGRICIGSDHPEVKLEELRDKFELLSKDIERNKKEKIAHGNLEGFMI